MLVIEILKKVKEDRIKSRFAPWTGFGSRFSSGLLQVSHSSGTIRAHRTCSFHGRGWMSPER